MEVEDNFEIGEILIGKTTLRFIKSFKETLKNSQMSFEYDANNDLISRIYEGGFKIWECTFDLLQYLQENFQDFSGLDILDLGCGQGLLGIYCLKNQAKSCVFQDFNEEVLKIATANNLRFNAENTNTSNFNFISGDWKTFPANLSFDVILASETIYNPENYDTLIELFQRILKTNGKIFLASKDYYFGVGGSVNSFLEICTQKKLPFKIVKETKGKSAYKRKIILIESPQF